LPVIKDDNRTDWISFEDLKVMLDKKKLPSESRILSSNIFRWLKTRDRIVREVRGKPAFTIKSVINFFLAHSDQYQICNKISNEIQNKLLRKQSDTIVASLSSVRDVYNAVSNAKFLDKLLLPSLDLNKSELHTLHDGYKNEFSDAGWRKICFFEYHFMRSLNVNMSAESYESMLLKKIMYFESLQK